MTVKIRPMILLRKSARCARANGGLASQEPSQSFVQPPIQAIPQTTRESTKTRYIALVACFAWAGALATLGCIPIGAASRGKLARPEMNPASHAHEDSFHSHVEAAREAGFGGHGAQGGGCGCG